MPSYLRGAIPSPRHLAFAVSPHSPTAVPPAFGVIPNKLLMWGNDTYGDCVTAEEAAAKAMYSVLYGSGLELVPTNQEVITWAKSHGVLNGANLTDVMDGMARDGMSIGGVVYKDGPYQSVDWTNDAVLSSAIYQGPVKIAVAANQVEKAVNGGGDKNGWLGLGWRYDGHTDHAVNLCGFGAMSSLAEMMKITLPSSVSATTRGYLLYTWSTIGIVDQASMINVTTEAWLRTPTTIGPAPVPPIPPVPPVPPGPLPSTGVIYIDIDSHVVSLPGGWSVVPSMKG